LKSSSSTSSSEVDSLRIRIASLEASNRDTVAVLESKSTANDALAQDLQKQHQRGLELNQKIVALQQSVQNADSVLSSARFREQSLNQELEQARRNNEWLDTELKTKSAEGLKFRKEKNARIAELQRQNEEANANLDALKRTELALRSRLEEVQKKAEDAWSKVQQLQEAAATMEEGYRQELESSRRLAELQSQQTETHRNRLKEVEASLEQLKDETAEEIRTIQQEAEAERQERERLEKRTSELEAEIDHLHVAASSAQAYPVSVPGTPRQGLNGSVLGRAGSPTQFGTPGSMRSKSMITATQAIEELYKVKGQLATERRRNEQLTSAMEEMVQGLEAKQPEIEDLEAEHQRLQQELVRMSKFVDQAGNERDQAKKNARKAESEAATSQAEANILRQQMRDLSAQIKMLLCDLDARERGLDALSVSERAQLERLAKGEVSEGAFEGLTDTDRFISERLTVFRSISELQEKNQELLKITRQLGQQMESEEALAAKIKAAKDHEQVLTLEKRIESYKDELKSMVTRSESYMKERDMFRRMLQHRGQLPPAGDLNAVFGQSIDGNGVLSSVEQSPNGKDSVNYAALLRELQSHFDQYREEQAIDRRTMKEQTEKLSAEKGSLQSEIAKASSQLTLANERYEMLHANYTMLQSENAELQKRSQILSEAAAKQDLRTQQVAEDLIEAKGLVESIRNENANLKAEKKLWKEIQDRLSEDNEGLRNERNRLNVLAADQQNLLNKRELAESETRRRLQGQVESLENELNATKRKLNDEVEDNKRAQLRKEYDSQQSQKRIDDLMSSMANIREELVAAKTTRDHLQARVDELSIELKSAEERVQVLQPRPTPRPGTQGVEDIQQNPDGDGLNREQELAIEVSELKRDLDLSKSELESTKAQMEQYRAISQASEEELQNFNETQEQYRQEMDRLLEEKDARIRELQQRVEDLSAELTTINTELNTLRSQQSEISRRAEEEKASLEKEIARLKDEDERHATAAQFHQQDLRAQAEIAAKAQQDYEHELVKHAEAAKFLQSLRAEYNQLKSESAGLRAEAESAKVALNQSQSSWEERREQLEKELSELRARRDDIGAQNRLLLQQLEGVSSQVATLQQNRAIFTEIIEPGTPTSRATPDRSVDGLRELVTYLRRDKEIVDVQYELSIQETKRLRQQLDYLQSQLDESRMKLEQERRTHADGSRNSMAHKDLMEKLNELNLFRESSITLRNEARQAQAQLADKTKQVEELLESIQPLETKVRELENIKEMQEGEIQLLQEDRDRWQKRNQEILSKYDRIDPAEMEQLKESVSALQAEREALLASQQPLQEQVQGFEAEKAAWLTSRTKLIEQAKERSRKLIGEKNEKVAERDTAIQEKEALEQQLSNMRQELDNSIQEKQSFEQRLIALEREVSLTRSNALGTTDGPEQEDSDPAHPGTTPAIQGHGSIDHQLAALRKELETAIAEKNEIEQQLTAVRQELEATRAEKEEALSAAAALRKAIMTSEASGTVMQNGVEEGQIDEAPQTTLADAERKAMEERVTAAEAKAREVEAKLHEVQESMDNVIKQRSEKMKTALNNKLAESRASTKAALEEEYKVRYEQDKQIWLAEHTSSSAGPAGPTAPPPDAESTATTGQAATATPSGKSPASHVSELSNMSDAQVRELLSTNGTAKAILMSNLKKKLEIETQKLKDEYEKSAAKAEDAKTQAVLMEGKKSALKINMAENKLKAANAKIEVVEKAATETPERPVGEVWEIAKNAKPAPNTSALNNGKYMLRII
jgi:nucleoprotein TPR